MNITSLIIQLLSGAAGGNIVAKILKQFDLGPVGNSIAGIVGGVLLGQILTALGASPADVAAAGGMDVGTIVTDILGGGVGGGALMVIVGLIKQQMQK